MRGILLDTNYDFLVTNNKLQVGDCAMQTAEMILKANAGEFKEMPMIGGGVDLMTAGSVSPFWRGRMLSQFKEMKIAVEKLVIDESGISVMIND